ncbi:glutathione S-transferase family protein [Aggregicoccus sp. 17bor-14]|uniref:glutathione S-transferase family protein n=1 Tax=Myxococcaceae TaxID=31 RepID=UPI00129C3C02|nr:MULTISPECIES: glutathione S-transferase family protein [Myxococcaceae]MBF5041943.1 glutathione S-transferase family protein [Simulacricoccus sp. 17bor-14]MRI87724.1 glutathione S-transferase family protein [Aggregicoccus sp. 17bor-14]
MKLYAAPRTRAIRPRWLLEELEVPYALQRVEVSQPEGVSPEMRALHPLGEVPVLVDGALTLFESSAICLYLADRFPEKGLAPLPTSAQRGPYLQWLLFAEVTLEPLVLEQRLHAMRPEAPRPAPPARLGEVLGALERHLEGREYVATEGFTAADLVLSSILHLAHTLRLLERYPRLSEYTLRCTKRPAVRRAVMG